MLWVKRRVQVEPVGIVRLDQPDLPVAAPFLDGFFARNGGCRVVVSLEPDETIDTVFGGEARKCFLFVLRYTPDEVFGDAEIQRSVLPAGDEIDEKSIALY